MRFLLLLLFTSTAAAAPVNVDKQLAYAREMLTERATAMCACTTEQCREREVDAYLKWKVEIIVVRGVPGYEDYVTAFDADAAITQQEEKFQDCNDLLFAKPWGTSCRKRIANAASQFARAAPKAYKPYRTLQFENEPFDDPAAAVAAARINPGRSWDFRAVFGARSIVRDFGIEPADVTEKWNMFPSDMGTIATRRYGTYVAILRVESERFGEWEDNPAHHPLTKLFFEKMRAAADKCGGSMRAWIAGSSSGS